ncbi:hypothetical protein DINM_002120 [Dirofilaria immitis]|nr:hypothetical protein [Dirofilaria immitis]
MDGTKPSTSSERFDTIPPDTKDLEKRLLDAMDIVQVGDSFFNLKCKENPETVAKMAELDVAYQAAMREVERIQDILSEGLMEMNREQIDEMFDILENELRMAQHLAFWKSGVMFDVDKKLQNLIGRQTDSQQNKQLVPEKKKVKKIAIRKKAGKQVTKLKGPRSKRQAPTMKENIRRIERDTRSQSVVKGKGKDSPSPPAVSDQYISGRRKKMKGPEMSEGRRPRLPRKPRQSTSAVTEIVENENDPDPLYCLCRQKPKGKWYCPHCRGDRCDIINPDLID